MAAVNVLVFLLAAAVSDSLAIQQFDPCTLGVDNFQRDEMDCNRFYQCAPQGWVNLPCGPGTVFNPNINNCDHPYNVDCQTQDTTNLCNPNPCLNGGRCIENGNSYICQCQPNYFGPTCSSNRPNDSGPCRSNSSRAKTDGQCKIFERCVRGIWEDFICPDGTEFDPARADCHLTSSFTCQSGAFCNHEDKRSKNNGQCTTYDECVYGQWQDFNCPVGTQFDANQRQCVQNFVCQSGGFCNHGDKRSKNNGQCTTYDECVRGQWQDFNCPFGTQFDANQRNCAVNYVCQSGGFCNHEDKRSKNNGQCTTYDECVYGQWQDFNCPVGTQFDANQRNCVKNFVCQSGGMCTHQDKRAANNGQCRMYKECVQGVWRDYWCPTSEEFNPTLGGCYPIGTFVCQNTVSGVCTSSTCYNGGTCENAGTNSFRCRCPLNYEGTRCETYVFDAGEPSGYCANGEAARPSSRNCQIYFRCVRNQWMETRCPDDAPVYNTDLRMCDFVYNTNCGNRRMDCAAYETRENGLWLLHDNDLYCKHFYRCVNQGWTRYLCPANTSFDRYAPTRGCSFQPNCPTAPTQDPCASSPCRNNGICENFGTSYFCMCPIGISGDNCEGSNSACSFSTCLNGGSCRATGFNSFTCDCPAGYSGDRCQSTSYIDACTPSPCRNGGTCVRYGQLFYECRCAAGYSGIRCETSPQSCNPNPCQNGGVCNSINNAYSCSCLTNYGGENCELSLVVDGGWSLWVTDTTPLSSCDRVCGGGRETFTRRRTCSNPSPANGGLPCSGDNVEVVELPCNTDPCPCSSNPCLGQTCSDLSTTEYSCICPPFPFSSSCSPVCGYPCPQDFAMVYPDLTNSRRFVACINTDLRSYGCPDNKRYSTQRNDCV